MRKTMGAVVIVLGMAMASQPAWSRDPQGVTNWSVFADFKPAQPELWVQGALVREWGWAAVEVLPDHLEFRLENRSGDPLTINWNRSAMIIGQRAVPVANIRPGFCCDRPEYPEAMTIPAGSQFEGFLMSPDQLAWQLLEPRIGEYPSPLPNAGYGRLDVILNPEGHARKSGFCVRKNLAPSPADQSWGAEAQAAHARLLSGYKISLDLAIENAGKETRLRMDLIARGTVLVGRRNSCLHEKKLALFLDKRAQASLLTKAVEGMSLGECGYEYPTQNGEAND